MMLISDKNSDFAPIYIPTLCRHEHFKTAIESLKRNTWAKYTAVYIALDYPANERHFDGYYKICEYLEKSDFSVFYEFNVVRRTENMGSLANSDAIRDEIMTRYERWIYAEDDIEFSPIFLEYMNRCLDFFKDDPTVFAVNGYSYDIKWKVDPESTVFKQKGTVSEWGIGYWKDKYLNAQKELKNDYLRNEFNKAVKSGKLKDMISGRYCDYVGFALSGNKNSLYQIISDVSLGIYINLKDMYIITPVISKTRNHGFDGSGVYCSKIEKYTNKHSLEYNYDNQFIDRKLPVEIVIDKGDFYKYNIRLLSDFLFVSKRRKIVTASMMAAYYVLGQNKCEKFYQALKAFKYKMPK